MPLFCHKIIGCFILGAVNRRKRELSQLYFPLYVSLSSGLCGSITTFSSFSLDVFIELSNAQEIQRDAGHNVLAALSLTAVVMGMSLGSLLSGGQLGSIQRLKTESQTTLLKWISTSFLLDKEETTSEATPATSVQKFGRQSYAIVDFSWVDWIFVAAGAVTWVVLAIILGTGKYTNRSLILSCLLSPPGALLRYETGKLNNRWSYIPLGTYAVNLFGALLIAIVQRNERLLIARFGQTF
ncbi:hypothetical protein BC829DRAFT_161552 [Chytridium lagenaria]|nr:hypothetical protein BC829DRAFT_161552 [Chytridium lagenaria]